MTSWFARSLPVLSSSCPYIVTVLFTIALKLPITTIPNTDEIIIFRKGNIYLAKIAFNGKTSILAISNNLEVPNIDLSLKDDNDTCK